MFREVSFLFGFEITMNIGRITFNKTIESNTVKLSF